MKTPKVFVNQQFQQEIANHTNSGYSIASFDYHSHKSNKKALFQNKRVEKQHWFAKKRKTDRSSFWRDIPDCSLL